MPAAPSVRLLVASRGNEFMIDIARTFASGFDAAGVVCEVAVDGVPGPEMPGLLQVVVAPHEYFPLFLAERLTAASIRKAAAPLYVLNVEQPGSPWFETAAESARACRGIFDISAEGVEEWERRGLSALHTPIGFVAPPDLATFAAPADRPIDILFLGHSSPRRDRFLAAHARTFSRFTCRFVFTDVGQPRLPATPGYYAGRERSALLGASRILLNVHASDRRYFETHRALLALSHRCLLVTESSRGTRPLDNGSHFVMAPLDDLAERCAALLDEPDRLTAVATAGHEFARDHLSMRRTVDAMLDHVAGTDRRSPAPRPSSRAEDEAMRREAAARLKASLSARASGGRDWTLEDNRSFRASSTPAVSVVVTVFNYARVVTECLESVLRSNPVPGGFEVVVVDDASTDDSTARVHEVMADASTPMRLVRKSANTGLADARNLGIEHARGAGIFTLDADNLVLPSCLRVLSQALAAGDHAAAYGLIQRFDDDSGEPLGLLSKYAWSVRDLVRAPYIDAMALFTRDALDEAGGYSTELIEHGWFGWEDYDLWLKLAEAGRSAVLVPAILAAYRVHGGSMLSRTNRSSAGIAKHFHHKFRRLVESHPELDQYFGFPRDGAPPASAPAMPAEAGLDALDARCRELETRLDAMYTSWSWRITRPLRFVFRLLTGRR